MAQEIGQSVEQSDDLVQMTTNITVTQRRRLERLSARTRVHKTEYVREGLDMVLDKYPERKDPDE